jgi:hypothetical protein
MIETLRTSETSVYYSETALRNVLGGFIFHFLFLRVHIHDSFSVLLSAQRFGVKRVLVEPNWAPSEPQ